MEIIEQQEISKPVKYAGFWLRFVASLIDAIALSIVHYLIILPLVAVLGIGAVTNSFSGENAEVSNGFMAMIVGASFVTSIIMLLINVLYFVIMEASKFQATLGKMALNLKVTNMQGDRINAGQAIGRYFGKIISALILFIGYIMAGLTEKKQALHDIMAGCLVIRDEQ
jgi:uncharacterized RDD family membrane protein YckC